MSEQSRKNRGPCLAIAVGVWLCIMAFGLLFRQSDSEPTAPTTLSAGDQVNTLSAEQRQTRAPTLTREAMESTQQAIAVTQTIAAAIQAAQALDGTGRWGLTLTGQDGTPYVPPEPGVTAMWNDLNYVWRALPEVWRTPDGVQPRYQIMATVAKELVQDCGMYQVGVVGADRDATPVATHIVERERFVVVVEVVDLASSDEVGEQTIYGETPRCPGTTFSDIYTVNGPFPGTDFRAWLVELLGDEPSLPEP